MSVPTHLSYSQINCCLSCPLRYRLTYIDQLDPGFVTESLVFGSAIHQAAATFYQSCLEAWPVDLEAVMDV